MFFLVFCFVLPSTSLTFYYALVLCLFFVRMFVLRRCFFLVFWFCFPSTSLPTFLVCSCLVCFFKFCVLQCSRAREQDSAVVYDLLPAAWARRRPGLEVCGRLDKHASGLVLLSQDGKINFAAIARGHEREYEVPPPLFSPKGLALL